MNLTDIPLFSMLKSRLGYLTQRQTLIAQNVANADTPGYAPQDLTAFTVPNMGGASSLAMAPVPNAVASQAGFMPLKGTGSSDGGQSWTPQAGSDSETRVDGNKVVLEEQMMKMTDARMNYDTAIGLYEKSMAMLQLAIRTPGKGA